MKYLSKLLFLLLGLLPFVPSIESPASIAFSVAFMLFAFACVGGASSLKMDRTSLLILFYVFVINPIFVLTGIRNGWSAWEAVSSYIPSLFLIAYVLIQLRLTDIRDDIPELITLSSLSWASSIVLLNFDSFLSAVSGDLSRLTYEVNHMLIPFGMIGYIACIYSTKLRNIYKYPFLILLVFLILSSGYRSQILICIAVTLFRYRNIYSRKAIAAVAGIILTGIVYTWVNPNFTYNIMQRLESSTADAERRAERRYAVERILEKPVLGHGYGMPIPLAETRPAASLQRYDVTTVTYMHNFTLYMLMYTGLLGTVFLYIIILPPIVRSARPVIVGKRADLEFAFMSLVSIALYFHISASFKQIQIWIVASSLLILLNYPKGDLQADVCVRR